MGAGGSQGYYGPGFAQRLPPSNYGIYGKKKRRGGLFRGRKPAATSQPVIPVRYRSPHRHSYRSPPYIPPIVLNPSVRPSIYPGYMPLSYNNYNVSPYGLFNQPYAVPQQQISPMLLPQSQPMMMPQFGAQFPQTAIPQPISSPTYSPYMSSPYSAGVPMSTPYVQQQPQVQPYYSNMNYSAPISTGISSPMGPYTTPYQVANMKLSTDWTGGGKISPGFLGPPI